MKRLNYYKRIKIIKINYQIFIIISIIFLTLFFMITSGKKVSKAIYEYLKVTINYNINNIINSNIKDSTLKKQKINDLITLEYNKKGEIVRTKYNLEEAYSLLTILRKDIIKELNNNPQNTLLIQNVNNNMIINIPFYSYTNNLLLANIGPKVKFKCQVIDLFNGEIETKIKAYGINSILLELYLNLNITSSIYFLQSMQPIVNNYHILVASTVIEGTVPSYYNGILENTSGNLNIDENSSKNK